ncbi:MAG: glycoside hydrolase family 172 protein [Myxococcaceae bacterium]
MLRTWLAASLVLLIACNPPSPRPDGGTLGADGGPVEGPTTGANGTTLDGGTPTTSSFDYGVEPAGMEALSAFTRLPYLKHGVQALSHSSMDPLGGNVDRNVVLYDLPSPTVPGEQVIFDAQGPGVIYRFWSTRGTDNRDGDYRFYFDGEKTPRITVNRELFWGGTNAPFTAPFTLTRQQSSGGHITYFPIGFAKSLIITETGQRDPDYFNFHYALYSNGAKVETYTGREDGSLVRSAWSAPGSNPNGSHASDERITGQLDVQPGTSVTLAEVTGPRQLTELRFNAHATDEGRAFTGGSRFRVKIDAANSGVTLIRRFDYGIADQRANVLVDGQTVGVWATPGVSGEPRWRNSTFDIPAQFTSGKTSIEVTIQFVSSAADWNEFYYWVNSKTPNGVKQTDTLDVANTASEQAHQYEIASLTFTGSRSYLYPGIHRARLQIFWDGEPLPAVDAPAAEFFGTTAARNALVRALPLGSNGANNVGGDFYCFFPMPFGKSAKIVLTNPAGAPVAQGNFSITHRPFADDLRKVGYFRAEYRNVPRTLTGKDYVFLDVKGSGHFVGVNMVLPSRSDTLEGDERFFVDGSRTPAIHGTGTEDYFNGGWYFDAGAFSLPTHGVPWLPAECRTPCGPAFSAYRFHLADAVPFSASLRASIEHGAINDNTEPYSSVAYFYLNPTVHLLKTDKLDVGDNTSELAHSYLAETVRATASLNARFVGDNPEMTSRLSRTVSGSVTFTIETQKTNQGLVLRRLFDSADLGQTAEVHIDGALVGVWRTPLKDITARWREEDFAIPKSFTQGKSKLMVKLVIKSPVWNEATYEVFARMPATK